MKRILLASVAALGLAGTASAADLAVKAPVVYAPVFTWTGCYVGINGGWIGSDGDTDTSRVNLGGVDPDNPTTAELNLLRRSLSSDESGGTAGGQFGCQWQMGSWVLGGEWDWNWTSLEDETTASFGVVGPWAARQEHHQKQLDWFMTARARLGWAAWDRFLIYATGGLAVGSYDAYTRVDFATGSDYYGSARERRLGWTAGAGFEWAFANNWTAKAEFLYLDFGSFDYDSPSTTFGTGDSRAWRTDVDAQEYVVRVGLNYLFHLDAPPVAARF